MARGPSKGVAIGSVILGVMLVVAVILLMLLVLRPPSATMRVAIGPAAAEPCPVESGGTACYRFEVANTGQADGLAECGTTPAPGTEAVFANGASVVDVRLQAGEIKGVYVRVTPAAGSDQVGAPALDCRV